MDAYQCLITKRDLWSYIDRTIDGRGPIERLALGVLAARGRKPLAALLHWNGYGNRTRQEGC